MLRNTLRFSFALVAIVALVGVAACGKDKGKSADKSGGAANQADAPATKTFTLAQVDNLKVELPAGANISKGVGSGVMIMAPDLVVSISRAGSSTAKTLDAAKKDAQMFKPQKLKAEKLSDGFALTFENKGGLGRNYFVRVVRVIGGKAYSCTTTASRPAQKANALKVCKTLHK